MLLAPPVKVDDLKFTTGWRGYGYVYMLRGDWLDYVVVIEWHTKRISEITPELAALLKEQAFRRMCEIIYYHNMQEEDKDE